MHVFNVLVMKIMKTMRSLIFFIFFKIWEVYDINSARLFITCGISIASNNPFKECHMLVY